MRKQCFTGIGQLTLRTLMASSHTCIPRDSKTSTQPRYLTEKTHVADRTAASSACHWCGFDASGTRSLRRRNESRNDLRSRSIFFGDDLLLLRNEDDFCEKRKFRLKFHSIQVSKCKLRFPGNRKVPCSRQVSILCGEIKYEPHFWYRRTFLEWIHARVAGAMTKSFPFFSLFYRQVGIKYTKQCQSISFYLFSTINFSLKQTPNNFLLSLRPDFFVSRNPI